MAVPSAPRFPQAVSTNPTSVDVLWQPPLADGGQPITAYEVGIHDPVTEETEWQPTPDATLGYRVAGLVDGKQYAFSVRAVNTDGTGPASSRVTAAPDQIGTLTFTRGNRLDLLDMDRQSLILRLPAVDVRVTVWWQPFDEHWYGSLEVPVGTRVVSGRRLVVGSGLVDRLSDVLDGNIVCRALAEEYQNADPDRAAWREETHGLFWEPA